MVAPVDQTAEVIPTTDENMERQPEKFDNMSRARVAIILLRYNENILLSEIVLNELFDVVWALVFSYMP